MAPRTRAMQMWRVSAGAATIVLAIGLLAGCGDESGSVSERQTEEIQRAKEEGRRQALAEERAKAAAADTRRLEKEIEQLGKDDATSDRPGRAPAPPAQASSGSTSCGEGVSVNSVTTCPFGRNVRDEYASSNGARVIEVYSPVTKRSYLMRCTGGVPTVCRGGNGAIVYLR